MWSVFISLRQKNDTLILKATGDKHCQYPSNYYLKNQVLIERDHVFLNLGQVLWRGTKEVMCVVSVPSEVKAFVEKKQTDTQEKKNVIMWSMRGTQT